MNNRTRLLAAVALVSTAAAVLPYSVAAGPPDRTDLPVANSDAPDIALPGMFDPPTPAELDDLRTLSHDLGISFEEAIRVYGWRRSFGQLVADIASRYPDDFAGAAIDDGTGQPWIGFKDSVPADAHALVGSLEPEVLANAWTQSGRRVSRVDYRPSRGYSERELHDRVAAVHMAAYENVRHAADLSTDVDPATGHVTMTLSIRRSADGTPAANERALLDRIDVNDNVSVRVVAGALGSDEATHRGGSPMTSCTAAFTVVQGSNRGMSTAAHCSDQQTMNGVALNYVFAHEGTNGDFQWHLKSGQSFPDDFYSGSTTTWNANLRDVAGLGYNSVGTPVCMNGKTTFKHCDTIKALGHCYNGSCNLVRVYEHQSAGGDSGSPWFYGNAAFGVHKGYNLEDWAYRSIYSRSDLMEQTLQVIVAYT
jgi:hypothetical protein